MRKFQKMPPSQENEYHTIPQCFTIGHGYITMWVVNLIFMYMLILS